MDAAASASGDAGDTSARQARTDSRAAQADVATAVDNVDVTLGGAGSDSDTKASDADAAPVSRPREESVADMARRSRLQTGDCTPTAQPDAESLVSTQIAAGADAKRRPALTDRASVLTGIILVFVSVAIDMLGVSIILPVLPFYALEFNASSFEVGIIFSSYALAQAISTPISGKLSDKFGRRTMILMSLAGSCGGFLFQGFSNSYGMFLAARFSAGVAGASVPIAMAFICDVTTPQERPKYLAFLGAIIGAAFLFGPGIGSGLAQFSLNTPMFVSSALAGLGFVISYFKLKDPSDLINPEAAAASSVPKPESAASATASEARGTDLDEREKAQSTSYTLLICAAEFLNMASFTSVLTMLGLYMEEKFGFQTLELGFLFSFQSVVFVIVQLTVFPRMIAKFGKHGTAIIGCFVFAAGLALMPISGSLFPVLVAGVFCGGAGYGMVQPSLPSLMSRYNSKEHQGRAMGLGQSMQALARVIIPALFGLLYDVDITLPFYASSGCCVLNAVLIFAILRKSKSYKRGRAQSLVDATVSNVSSRMAPAVLSEARKIAPERIQLLGQLTGELLVKAGYTSQQLNSEAGLGIALTFLEVSLDNTTGDGDDDIITAGEVGEVMRASANVRGS